MNSEWDLLRSKRGRPQGRSVGKTYGTRFPHYVEDALLEYASRNNWSPTDAIRAIVERFLLVKRDGSYQLDRVEKLVDFCERVGLSESTLRRLIRLGEGPTLTKLSERRFGIRYSDGDAWLTAREVKGEPA